MTKSYLLFAFDKYYPVGGWDDYRGAYATLEEAWKGAANEFRGYQFYQIVDLTTLAVVATNREN